MLRIILGTLWIKWSSSELINWSMVARCFKSLSSVVCDDPPHDFMKNTKLPGGYSSCDKCVTKGEHKQLHELPSDLSTSSNR